MRILIANYDYENDPYNESFNSAMNRIRKCNSRGTSDVYSLYDPFGVEKECTLGGAEKVFGYSRNGLYNGIIEQSRLYKDVYTASDGYQTIKVISEIMVNPMYMPFLSQETLTAYMPQIPWDEFGNHIRLEGADAEQFMSLWNTFIRQNRDLYNAVNRLEYPLDECRSNIGYIFMENEID